MITRNGLGVQVVLYRSIQIPFYRAEPIACVIRLRLMRSLRTQRDPMYEVTYEIVEHDGGWAYKVDGAVSYTHLTLPTNREV